MVPPALPSPPVPPSRLPPPLTTYPTFFVLHLLFYHLFFFPPHSLSYYRARTRVQEQHASIPFHMNVDRSSMCASTRAEGTVTDGGSRRREAKKRKRERKDTRGHGAVADVASQGEKESKEENRGGGGRGRGRKKERKRKRGGGERGWPFDEHGGPSMDVRRGPWRHTCTSPRPSGREQAAL